MKFPPLRFTTINETVSALRLIDLQHFPLCFLSNPVELYTMDEETLEFCTYLSVASLELKMVLTVVVILGEKMALVYPDLINRRMNLSYVDIEIDKNDTVIENSKIDYTRLIKNKISNMSPASNLHSLLLQSVRYKFGNDGNLHDVEHFLDVLIPLLTG